MHEALASLFQSDIAGGITERATHRLGAKGPDMYSKNYPGSSICETTGGGKEGKKEREKKERN